MFVISFYFSHSLIIKDVLYSVHKQYKVMGRLTLFLHSEGIPSGILETAFNASTHYQKEGEKQPRFMCSVKILLFIS